MPFDKTLLNRLVKSHYADTGKTSVQICQSIADECGLREYKTVERWLNVKLRHRPSPESTIALAELFDCTVNQLNGDGTHEWSEKVNPVAAKRAEKLINEILEWAGLPNTLQMVKGKIVFSAAFLLSGFIFGLTGNPIPAISFTVAGILTGAFGVLTMKTGKLIYGLVLAFTATAAASPIAIKAIKDARKPDPSPPPPATESVIEKGQPKPSDRAAAVYLTAIGGQGKVKDEKDAIHDLKDIPATGSVVLTEIDLLDNKQVNDAGLANLKDCKSITWIRLIRTNITNAGAAYLKSNKELTYLALDETLVTDAGLENFKDCKKLGTLFLSVTKIGDKGFKNFKDCDDLAFLNLSKTNVTNDSLAICAGFNKLKVVNLGGTTAISDKGLEYLGKCSNLTELTLWETAITDQGLSHLKELKNLKQLGLGYTKITDKGLAKLRVLKSLEKLDLIGTKVTANGIADLQKALPDCKIDWMPPK